MGGENKNLELEKMKDTLGNKKLDKQEIDFLKSRQELVLKLQIQTEKKLLDDIKETNKVSFEKDDKTRQILNGFWMNPDSFLNQLGISTELTKIKNFMSYLDNQKGIDSIFYKQIFCVSLLLRKAGYKDVLKIGGVNIYNFDFSKYDQSPNLFLFNTEFVKALHSFQKKYASVASTKGRSEADCIVGHRTIQQLCSKIGISPTVGGIEIDSKFSQSNFNAKEKYNWASEAQTQIDNIIADKGISNAQKVRNMVEICKKTTTKASDGTDKRYAVVVYMISNIQILLPNIQEQEKQEIIQILSDKNISEEIKKYWNEKNSNKIKKSNNFLEDLNKGVEQKNENFKKFGVIYGLCQTWAEYYYKEEGNDDGDIINKKKIESALNIIQSFQNRIDKISEKEIQKQLDNVFISTMADNLITLGTNEAQKKKLNTVKIKLLGFAESNELWKNKTDILKLRSDVLGKYREIDGKFDSIISKFGGYSGGEAILSEIEKQEKDQKLSSLNIDTKGISIENGYIEYSKFNTDINKVNTIFSKLDQSPPDELTLKEMEKIMSLLDIKYRTYVNGNLRVGKGATDKFKNLFGFSMSIQQRDALYKTLLTIQKNKEKIKNEAITNFKKNLELSNTELNANIVRYKNEIEYLKNTNSLDPKIKEYEQYISNMETAITNNNKGINGENYQTIDNSNNSLLTTINSQAELLANNMATYMFTKALEKSVTCSVIEKNGKAINKLKNKQNKTAGESIIDLYSNIKGIGSYRSDETYNTVLEVTKEIIIQVAICAISAGVGGLVMKGVMAGTKRALTAMKVAKTANSLGRYANIASKGIIGISKTRKTLNTIEKTGAITVGTIDAVVQGTAFHISSTMLNNAIQGVDITSGLALDNKQNIRGYLQSIAFLGVIKEVGSLGLLPKKINDKNINSVMNTSINTAGKTFKFNPSEIVKSLWIGFGPELGAMFVTEQVISVVFDQKIKVMTIRDVTHMVGIIIGLRLTHSINPLNKLNQKLDNYIIKDFVRGSDGNISTVKIESDGKDVVIPKEKIDADTDAKAKAKADAKTKADADTKKNNPTEPKVDTKNNEPTKTEAQTSKTIEQKINEKIEEAKKLGTDRVVVIENNGTVSVKKIKKIKNSKVPIEVRYQNGNIEKGPRKNGKLEGDNCFNKLFDQLENGIVDIITIEGTFKNGQLNGKGKRTSINYNFKTKKVEEGIFENGQLNGKGKRTSINYNFKTKKVEEGIFENGELNREGKTFSYENFNEIENNTVNKIKEKNKADADVKAYTDGKAKADAEKKKNNTTEPKEAVDENGEKIKIEDEINLDEPINTPENTSKLKKLIVEIEKDNSIPKRIDRKAFVSRGGKDVFDISRWKLFDGLNKTLIRHEDLVVSRRGEKFTIEVDKDGKAFLVDQFNLNKKVEFTETMINNYKVIKRATETGSKGLGYRATKIGDFFQGWPIIGLTIKYPRKFIKYIKNATTELKSFFQSPNNPNIKKINKYNYIFPEKSFIYNTYKNTLGRVPYINGRGAINTIKTGTKSFFAYTPSKAEFNIDNRESCPNIRKTGINTLDLLVNKNGNEFITEIIGVDVFLKQINGDKIGEQKKLTENEISDYRVVKREGGRNLRYINGRIMDFTTNEVPIVRNIIRGGRKIANKF